MIRNLNDRFTVYLDQVGLWSRQTVHLNIKSKHRIRNFGPGANGQEEKQNYKKYYKINEYQKRTQPSIF